MSGRQKGAARRASSVGVGGAPGSAKRRAKLKRRGGSKPGRAQNTGGSGWQFARRATVHGMFKSYGLDNTDIPPLPGPGRRAAGKARHVAEEIADLVTLPNAKQKFSSRTVYTWLTEMKEKGWENWDPMTDGRAEERPNRRKLNNARDLALLKACSKTMSCGDTAQTISDARAIVGERPVSESCVRETEDNFIGVVRSKTQETTMQTEDEEERWARGRLIVTKEWQKRIAAFRAGKAKTEEGWPALDPASIVWWDEHHHKCQQLPGMKVQRRYPVDEEGEMDLEDGETEPLVLRKSGKFKPQACGLFGCAIVDGKPFLLEPLQYSSTVVSVGRFEREIRQAIQHCWNLPSRPYDPITGRWIVRNKSERFEDDGSPKFLEGEGAKKNKIGMEGILRRVRAKHTNMRDLCDHMISEGDRAFAGTKWEGKWVLYHDPLKQFWEPETMDYMASRGFTIENGRILASLSEGPYKGELFAVAADSLVQFLWLIRVVAHRADMWRLAGAHAVGLPSVLGLQVRRAALRQPVAGLLLALDAESAVGADGGRLEVGLQPLAGPHPGGLRPLGAQPRLDRREEGGAGPRAELPPRPAAQEAKGAACGVAEDGLLAAAAAEAGDAAAAHAGEQHAGRAGVQRDQDARPADGRGNRRLPSREPGFRRLSRAAAAVRGAGLGGSGLASGAEGEAEGVLRAPAAGARGGGCGGVICGDDVRAAPGHGGCGGVICGLCDCRVSVRHGDGVGESPCGDRRGTRRCGGSGGYRGGGGGLRLRA